MNDAVVIHVGLIKTGSTFLQKQIFPKLKDVKVYNNPLSVKHNGMINIVSNEALSGNPYLARRDDRFGIADRLKLLHPDAKIIVITREFEGWLRSVYVQYVKNGGVYSYDDWYNQLFDESYLDTNSYVSYVKQLFNEVYVDDYTRLVDDPVGFVRGICDFIDVPVPVFVNRWHNVGWSDRQVRMGLFLNRHWTVRLPPVSPRMLVSLFNGRLR